ncbi:hypothetical protein HY251_21135 [bacterium]|nr:hypothetical protein [bacterium]
MAPTESALFSLVRRVRPVGPHARALVCGHRGAPTEAPENTLASFARALEVGAELVEFDVQVASCGELVVIHDDGLERTTNGTGEARKLPAAEIRELDAGSWFSPAFLGERVPTLDETLDLLRGRAVPLIEVKVSPKRSPDAGERVVRALERHGMLEDAVVICHDTTRAAEVRRASPGTPISLLAITKRQARAAATRDEVSGLDIYWKSISLKLVTELRARPGFFLTPWTVNRPADQERLLGLGVEALITDAPAALRALVDRLDTAEVEARLTERLRSGEDVDLELEPGTEPSPEALAAQEACDESARDA